MRNVGISISSSVFLYIGKKWRKRQSRTEGLTSEEYIREIFDLDEKYAVEAMLSLGIAADKRPDLVMDEKLWEKVQFFI